MFRHLLAGLIPLVGLVSILEAAPWTLTIEAGDQDRRQTPIVVSLPADVTACEVRTSAGAVLPSQVITPSVAAADKSSGSQVAFILPLIERGQKATLSIQSLEQAASPSGPVFRASREPGSFEQLNWGDRPVLRYMCQPLDNSSPAALEASYKVFHHVFDPDGSRIITKGPGGKFTHHRGLFFGFNKVSFDEGKKQCDVWHCSKGAHQSHDELLAVETGEVLGRQRVAVGWHDNDGQTFAREQRELTTYAIPGGTMIDFAARVATLVGPITLDGDPQHAGFHFRADNEVADVTAKETYYLRPDGKGEPGATRNWDAKTRSPLSVDVPWNAMSFVLGTQRYTVLYLDHPANPKEARSSERDYGRFGNYFEYQITEAKPLTVRYRVWVVRGELTDAECRRLSADFVTPPAVSLAGR